MLYPCYISAVTVLYLYRKHQLDYLIIKVDFTFFSYNLLSLIEMNHAKGFARERGVKQKNWVNFFVKIILVALF